MIYHYGVLKLGPSCKIFMIHSLFQLLLVYRQWWFNSPSTNTRKRGVCYMLDPPDTCPYLSRDKIAEMSSAPLCMKTHRRHFGKIWYRNSVNFSSVNKLWSRKTHDSCNRMDVHISDMHFRYVFSSENDYLSNPLQKNCETKSAT